MLYCLHVNCLLEIWARNTNCTGTGLVQGQWHKFTVSDKGAAVFDLAVNTQNNNDTILCANAYSFTICFVSTKNFAYCFINLLHVAILGRCVLRQIEGQIFTSGWEGRIKDEIQDKIFIHTNICKNSCCKNFNMPKYKEVR